jgi:hypothetical protein
MIAIDSALREEICRILHDANAGKICPDPDDPTRYQAMADAVIERFSLDTAVLQRFRALALAARAFDRDFSAGHRIHPESPAVVNLRAALAPLGDD